MWRRLATAANGTSVLWWRADREEPLLVREKLSGLM